jgi:rhodanese-related sulfurtransferase
VAGGIDAWRAAGLPLTSTPLVEASQIDGPVLDVRQASEFSAGHLPSAHHVELGRLAAGASLPSRSWTVMCGHGERAATGASLLERAGYDITVVKGGPDDWAAHGGRHLAAASRGR